jgi:L-rhamnose-H+ transport protein
MNGSIAFAFVLATLGGLLTGAFALPMKFVTRWKWENTWLAFSFFGFVLIPAVIVGAAVPGLWNIYSQVPLARVQLIVGLGYLWGLGALTYGVGMERLGIGLGSAFVLGISTLVGTILPIFMAGTVSLKWAPFIGGLIMLLGGIAICGWGGSEREHASSTTPSGKKRRYVSGVAICIVSGVLSSLLNVGMVAARPVQELASRGPAPAWASGDAVWPMLLFGGFLANATYCAYLLVRNGSARLYLNGGLREWLGAFAMGAAWIIGVLMYGAGAFFMGNLGPIIGWPVFMSLMLVCAYLVGRLTNEWSGVDGAVIRRMNAGIVITVVSLFLIGYSR